MKSEDPVVHQKQEDKNKRKMSGQPGSPNKKIIRNLILEGQNLNFALPADIIQGMPGRSADMDTLPPIASQTGYQPSPQKQDAAKTKYLLDEINAKKASLLPIEGELISLKNESRP